MSVGVLPDDAETWRQLAACCVGRVLEIGCGQRRAWEAAVAVDIVAGDVRAAAERLPFRDGSFDRVIAHLALDVIADCEPVMRELARVLAVDGEVAAVVGGGPAADATDDDALVAVSSSARTNPKGDRRVRDEGAWRAWWPRQRVTFDRIETRVSGLALVPTLARLARIPEAAVLDAIGARSHARVVTWLVRVHA